MTERDPLKAAIVTPERLITMARDPRAKQMELPYLMRRIPFYVGHYDYFKATPWRNLARSQPIVQNCIVALTSQAIALNWYITSREKGKEDEYASDIQYHTDVLNSFNDEEYDVGIARMLYDVFTIPFGGALEIVRYPDGRLYKVLNIDAGTLRPTKAYGPDYPYIQSLPWNPLNTVVFRRDEIGRIYLYPRPEIDKEGWGMAPTEKAYLAIEALNLGDRYYVGLLTDTPEAGLLDLMDMKKDEAIAWARSWRELLTGQESIKVPILYDHEEPARWLPFSPSPADMMYDQVLKRYTQIITACFGIYISDIGLYEERQTLAGTIRTERRARRQGLGAVMAKIKNLWDRILPPHLEWKCEEVDPEDIRSRAAAKVATANAISIGIRSALFTQEEGRRQMMQDGIFTIKTEEKLPTELEGASPIPAFTRPQTPWGSERPGVAPSVGGRGGPGSLRLQSLAAQGFQKMLEHALKFSPPKEIIRRMVEEALKVLYPVVLRADIDKIEKAEYYERWLNELVLLYLGEESILAEIIEKQETDENKEKIKTIIEEELNKNNWWEIDLSDLLILAALAAAFTETATETVTEIQRALFEDGILETPELELGWEFVLTETLTLAQLRDYAGQMIQNVNEGTKFFIRRALYRGVKEGLSQARIRDMIAAGENIDTILADDPILESITKTTIEELSQMTGPRIDRILEFELNRARTLAKIEVMKRAGLTTKGWVHTGPEKEGDPCEICVENIALGYVPLDYRYKSVFGECLGPLAHPQGHCTLKINRRELSKFTERLQYWKGD